MQTESSEYILLDCGIEATATLFDGAKIRAIFLTHFHADHALGLLRLRYSKQHIACYHQMIGRALGIYLSIQNLSPTKSYAHLHP
ncbi:MBL fold metallo-hydrolase [Helicobacter canis]|uniref:MBL fold metallo-hydrolase n=1 Tax=Helicobacter canis TaxID=29419 RepID=UPI000E0EF00F|nr:MBL fold metallo-hydrolase [Helicobacter canis]